MNLDQECKEAMAEKFVKPKEETRPRDDLHEAYLRQIAAMQNSLNPYWGIRHHIQQAAHWNDPLANFDLLGTYR